MAHATQTRISGEVTEVFAHRFVVQTADGAVLADLGPRGSDKVLLRKGDTVALAGEQQPSELKVTSITTNGRTVEIERKREQTADPRVAIEAVRDAGHTVVGEPRRKPEHFEVLARDKAGTYHEHHIRLDGTIRKSKSVDDGDAKWARAIKAAS